jgi:hypothetical protein
MKGHNRLMDSGATINLEAIRKHPVFKNWFMKIIVVPNILVYILVYKN